MKQPDDRSRGRFLKPVPVVDQWSEGFWLAAGRHTLAMQRCAHCGHLAYPPTQVCAICLDPDPQFHFDELSGRGLLRCWTLMIDTFLPGFRDELPFVIADIELIEQPGLRIIAQLRGASNMFLRQGAPVTVAFRDLPGHLAVPEFELERSS